MSLQTFVPVSISALARAKEVYMRKLSQEEVLAAVCRVYDLPLSELASRARGRRVSEARAMAARKVGESAGLSLVELGKRLNQDGSSLSQAARRLDVRIGEDDSLKGRLAALETQPPDCQA